MSPLATLNAAVERCLMAVFSVAFGLMIAVVLLQVVSRNAGVAVLWTLDAAQLLFSWCIFLGAAVGVRRGAHYVITLLPDRLATANAALKLVSDAMIAIVAGTLLYHGVAFTGMGLSAESESLPISRVWNFVPIPMSGLAMLMFLAEIVVADVRTLVRSRDGTPT